MNGPTKRQHYVWRNYLAAWTKTNSSNGQIMCLRDKKFFPVSLMKIAQENCFYGVKELSQQERAFIYETMVRNTSGTQRKVNGNWLDLYCAPFDLADELSNLGYSIFGHTNRAKIVNDQNFKNWNIEYIEKIHAKIEEAGVPYISLLRQDNINFWKNEAARDEFSFFLCNQYFRTKKIRDNIIAVLQKAKPKTGRFADICPENMWIPFSLIFATNVGAHIAQKYSAILLQADGAHFIVGDQPVINTHSTYDMAIPPDSMELYYPISPRSALLLTSDCKYSDLQIIKVSADEVKKYNQLEQRAAKEMIFAKDISHFAFFSPCN